MRQPTITDVLAARGVLAGYLPVTPMWSYPGLSAATGATTFVKQEHAQPTGAFKVRGGIVLAHGMSPAERAAGLLGYSTGNHAQSLAYAARQFDMPCTIVMPVDPNPIKAAAVRALGAELVEFGENFDVAREHAADLAKRTGARLVSSGDEPDLIAGVGTIYLEIFEREPALDAVLVPVGGGSGASGACIVGAALAPGCKIIGVQSSASPAAHDSWRAGHGVRRPNHTAIEAVATGSTFDLPQQILRAGLADFLLVDDADVLAAQRLMLRVAHTMAEGGGATALAALLKYRHLFAGQRVAVVCTGGNVSVAELAAVVQEDGSGSDA
ncbi:MAG TPA: pyridoxal-phosphate dependent enzyme [Pseudonocardiaceae bacterium]|jgi:threonine dehydratase|nr:pyridoxal-phosphate dependent enzyme [Pseudonocardiaceae bacterium]